MPYFTHRKKPDGDWITDTVKKYFAMHDFSYYYHVEALGEKAVSFKDTQGNQLVVTKEYAREHFYPPDYEPTGWSYTRIE